MLLLSPGKGEAAATLLNGMAITDMSETATSCVGAPHSTAPPRALVSLSPAAPLGANLRAAGEILVAFLGMMGVVAPDPTPQVTSEALGACFHARRPSRPVTSAATGACTLGSGMLNRPCRRGRRTAHLVLVTPIL